MRWRSRKSGLVFRRVFAVLYLILIGLFGVEALAQMKFPAVTMMSRVQVTGGFFEENGCFYV